MTFSGVFVPLITPFDRAGAVALDALEALAHDVLSAGARGLVALGTTGEPGSLTEAERGDVAGVLARVCRERDAPLIVGGDPQRVPAHAAAVLALVPPFVRPGENGVVAYFTDLARRSPAPLIVYHVPYRTGQPLSAATLRRIAGIGNVAGVKLATAAIDVETVALLADAPPGFAILGGDDAFLSPLLAMGAHGGILASAHVRTDRFVELTEAWKRGDAARAREIGNRLAALSITLFAEPNPAVVKAVLHAHGRIPTPRVRLPLLDASPRALDAALAAQSGCGGDTVTAGSGRADARDHHFR
ncbi:dihydrodipicolinate synthase family protein [Actinoplanes sp. NPDC049316]|uniref:dihydrodipicolinate synthase family protein n=1 Tax=Actinoplanes sp. NPDC049316 TaxID=3154727 RepID=UPI00341377D8